MRGNDQVIRVQARDLADLPPPSLDDPGQEQAADAVQAGDDPGQGVVETMADAMAATVADLSRARTALDQAQADLLVDRGRAERAEAERDGERRRADDAEGRAQALAERVTTLESRLEDARRPLWERVIRVIKG